MYSALLIMGLLASNPLVDVDDDPFRWIDVGGHLSLGAPGMIQVGPSARFLEFLTLDASVTTDTSGVGYSGGLTLSTPSGFAPSATIEVGHQNVGDVKGVVSKFAGTLVPALEGVHDMNFNYMSLSGGFQMGSWKNFLFFIRGGMTHVFDGRTSRLGSYINSLEPSVHASEVSFSGWLPFVNIGFTFFVNVL